MASSKRYLEYVLDLLSELDDISYRAMMGEYVLYYRGRVFGGIYDDRFLIKPTESARRILPDADVEIPYDGAKGMLLAKSEDRELIANMVEAMYDELPKPKKRS
ncbi:MAG: TfoX/Sxy family protein [Lachnospiraceae bacterium]|nr:TfoX/Sxy family protein [Lachnospiraceae bacterium]